MSLQYLSGIGAAKKTKAQKVQAKTAKVQARTANVQAKQQLTQAKIQARGTAQQARQTNRQNVVKNTMPVKVLKAVAKQSPLAAQKIKKAVVVQKQRKAFKRAGEPLTVKPEILQVEEVEELPMTIEEGTEEINEPEFSDGYENEDFEEGEDLGIIYPSFGAPKKSKKSSKKAAPKKSTKQKKQVSPAKKEARKAAVQKIGKGVLSVAKATLEAKGIKFPTNEQVQAEAEQIAPAEKPKKNSFVMPLLITGGAVALFMYFKK